MRRTEQEFKAEILRRSRVYRQAQARKRKTLLGAGLCACLCVTLLMVLTPMGAANMKDAAPESNMLVMEDMKAEMSVVQSPQCPAEYMMDSAAVMEESDEPAGGDPTLAAVSVTVKFGEEEIRLDDKDSAAIMDCLASDDWIMSAANCLCDYTIYVTGEVYHYHSDCGTVQDASGRSLTLNEADKKIFNEIMARCPTRTD